MARVPAVETLTVSHTLGARVRDTRLATSDVFGEPAIAEVLARLDEQTRAVFTTEPAPGWVPETAFVRWMEQLWDGPCQHDAVRFAAWADRVTDRGFGTARRMIMGLASPWIILRRAGALWRTEHSHGDLTVTPLGDKSVRFELRDHPFTETAVSAAAISEAFRHIVFRCRVKWAKEEHEITADRTLVTMLEWG